MMNQTEKRSMQEHIIVCLSSAPSNANLIKTAARMAAAFGGTFTALYVKTPGSARIRPEDGERLQRHIRLAQSRGAAITTVVGEDIPYQIAEFARVSKVTKIVIGRSGMTRRFLGKKPLTEKLIELAPDLDVFIIPDSAGENAGRHGPHLPQPDLGQMGQWLLMLAILTGSTVIGFLFHVLHFTEANTITVYILGALLTALLTRSRACSTVMSLCSVLLFNFFFTEPRLSLYAYESGYPVTFAIMLAASLITGSLASRVVDHAQESSEMALRTKVLFETSQLLQKAGSESEILRRTAAQLLKLLHRSLVVYPVSPDGALGAPFTLDDDTMVAAFKGDKAIAQWVLDNRRRAGADTDDFPEAPAQYWAVRSTGAVFGVVGVLIGDRPLEPAESSMLLSVLGECALAMENSRNAREKEAAAVRAKNEQLRADLLRAISHDLRTPLTAISGNAENLLANDAFLDPDARRLMLSDIYDDASWLIQLVENLLAITRIDEGRMQLNLSAQLVDEVVAEAARHVGRKLGGHALRIDLPEELMLANMDARLITQVLINLIDNAVKYTPEGSSIVLSARREGKRIALSVADDGPGIPEDKKARLFEMFYTGHHAVVDCRRSLGLGLPLCRSIVRAHGGEITLRDNEPHGCIFTFTLPASEVSLNE